MTPAASVRLQRWLPRRLLCKTVYAASRSPAPWLKGALIRWFHDRFGVDMSDALETDLARYATFNDFFTRALKPGARPIEGDAASVVAPCDGTLTEFGTLTDDRLLQAKGMAYSAASLLGESAAAFRGGRYATVYLAPHDYHRVHMPAAGLLRRTRYIPGERFSVNGATASVIPNLFCRNERAVLWFDCAFGPLAVVMVGALNVASLSTARRGEIQSGPEREWREPKPVSYARGAEIGRFNLGSTVVMLTAADAIEFMPALAVGRSLRMGAEIAHVARVTA